MKYDIFISYRRAGGWETAKHLFDLLTHDGYNVSFDIDTLRSGDFDTELFKRIDECTDFLLILNKGVFDRCFEIDKKNDWLRCELAFALEKKKNIIPIMLDGFLEFPDNLPEDIARVARKNGPKFDQHYFDAFYQKLKSVFLEAVPSKITTIPQQPTNSSCILKIRPNLNCSVFVDEELIIEAPADKITKIPLKKGTFWLEFVNSKNTEDKYACEYIMTDSEELLSIDLQGIAKKREEVEHIDNLKLYRKNDNEKPCKWGFTDENNNEIIPFKYDDAAQFEEGLAGVKLNGKWGFIDKTGKEIVPFKYDYNWVLPILFSEGFAKVKLNNKWGFIDKTGKEITPFKYDVVNNFYKGFAKVKINGKCGYIDKNGKQIIPIMYDDIKLFSDDLICICLNRRWGLINNTGKEVIPCKYYKIDNLSGNLAMVESNGKRGYIDINGKELIPLIYSYAWPFSEELASVKLNGKYGYIDKNGKEVIPFKYDDAVRFKLGLANVELNGKRGFIDKTGRWVRDE